MIKQVFLILLVFMCSISLKAQNALDLFNQAVSQYDEQHYSDAKETITAAITLAKTEEWEGEDWVNILLWKSAIEEKIDRKKAIIDYLYAIEICKNLLGEDHSYYGIGLDNLALLYKEVGEYEKALPLQLEVLKTTGKNLGKAHLDVLI